MTNWLSQKIAAVDAAATAVAVVVEADLAELVGLGGLAKSADFIADLKLAGTHWFYHAETGRRALLALFAHDEKKAVKDIRALAAKAAKALQAQKISQVDFVFSSSITNLDQLAGHFINNFENKNYETSFKRPLEEDKEADPRKLRHLSNVDNYEVSLEDAAIKDNESY